MVAGFIDGGDIRTAAFAVRRRWNNHYPSANPERARTVMMHPSTAHKLEINETSNAKLGDIHLSDKLINALTIAIQFLLPDIHNPSPSTMLNVTSCRVCLQK